MMSLNMKSEITCFLLKNSGFSNKKQWFFAQKKAPFAF